MKKITFPILILIIVGNAFSFSDDTKSKYQKGFYYTDKGRLVFPPNITVDVDTVEGILQIQVPYLFSLYNCGTTYLFSEISILPINVVREKPSSRRDNVDFINSEEYNNLLLYVLNHQGDLKKKSLNDLLEGDFLQKWDYQCIHGNRSLTIVPRTGSLLDSIKVPPFEIADFSYAALLKNKIIKEIIQKNDINPPVAKSYVSDDIMQVQDKSFPFIFKPLRYLVWVEGKTAGK